MKHIVRAICGICIALTLVSPLTAVAETATPANPEGSTRIITPSGDYQGGNFFVSPSYYLAMKALGYGSSQALGWVGSQATELVKYGLLALVEYLVFPVAGYFVSWAVYYLDGAVYYFVINMSSLFINNSVLASGILAAWGIIRDIANIAIIAGFVVVGISTILQVAEYAAGKYLARLIIAALLVNFSYFFAGAIIDASNYVARQVYTSNIMNVGCHEKGLFGKIQNDIGDALGDAQRSLTGAPAVQRQQIAGTLGGETITCSIGSSFNAHLNLDSWEDIKDIAQERAGHGQDPDWQIIILTLFVSVLYAVSGFVFFIAATFLVVRFIVLTFLLITSPIGIAGINIPYVDKYASRWWDELFSQAFFAPVFFLFIAVALTLTKNTSEILEVGGRKYANMVGTDGTVLAGAIPLLMVFAISIGMIVLALIVSRSMAGSGYFKAIYDRAFKVGLGTAKLPKRLLFDLPSQLAVRPLLEKVGANAREGSVRSYVSKKGSALLRYGEGFITGSNKDAKPFEDAEKAVLEARERKRDEPMVGGWLREKGLIERPSERLSPEQRKERDEWVQGQSLDDLIKKVGPDKVAKLARNGALSESQMTDFMKHRDFKPKEKEAALNAHLAKFNEAIKSGDQKEVLRIWGKMDEKMQQLVISQRKQNKTEAKLLNMLDHESFNKVAGNRDHFSEVEEKSLREARNNQLILDLRSDNEEKVKNALKRSSNSERANAVVVTVKDESGNVAKDTEGREIKSAAREAATRTEVLKKMSPDDAESFLRSLPGGPSQEEISRFEAAFPNINASTRGFKKG